MYSHFISYLGFCSTKGDKNPNGATLHVAYPILSIPCLLMPWWLKEPGHQQAWYWLDKPEYSISSIRRVFFFFFFYSTDNKNNARVLQWPYNTTWLEYGHSIHHLLSRLFLSRLPNRTLIMTLRCPSGKLWHLQHNSIGDTTAHHQSIDLLFHAWWWTNTR